MPIVRLIYASKPAIAPGELAANAEDFRNNNMRDGITGILVCDQTFFLQWVEGPRPAINQLYRTLLLDDRHQDLEILHFEEVQSRQFPKWDMQCIFSTDINESTLLRFMYDSEFNPYKLSGTSCVEFLKEVGRLTGTT